MNKQAVLEKAIEIAINCGWDTFGTQSQQIDVEKIELINGELQPDIDVDKPGIYIRVHRHHGTYSVPELIFNHQFAKALFGEEHVAFKETDYTRDSTFHPCDGKVHNWEHHLQNMVIAEDPIAYLEAHI